MGWNDSDKQIPRAGAGQSPVMVTHSLAVIVSRRGAATQGSMGDSGAKKERGVSSPLPNS